MDDNEFIYEYHRCIEELRQASLDFMLMWIYAFGEPNTEDEIVSQNQ